MVLACDFRNWFVGGCLWVAGTMIVGALVDGEGAYGPTDAASGFLTADRCLGLAGTSRLTPPPDSWRPTGASDWPELLTRWHGKGSFDARWDSTRWRPRWHDFGGQTMDLRLHRTITRTMVGSRNDGTLLLPVGGNPSSCHCRKNKIPYGKEKGPWCGPNQ